MREQAFRSLVAFTSCMPDAFWVMHKGTLRMAFRAPALCVSNAYFFRVVRGGALGHRGTSSANDVAIRCSFSSSSSRFPVTAASFSFALRFQTCNSCAITFESHSPELIPPAMARALIAFPCFTARHPCHAHLATRSFAKVASFVLALRHPLAPETYFATNPMRWCNGGAASMTTTMLMLTFDDAM